MLKFIPRGMLAAVVLTSTMQQESQVTTHSPTWAQTCELLLPKEYMAQHNGAHCLDILACGFGQAIPELEPSWLWVLALGRASR
jgi:hypothetical protein